MWQYHTGSWRITRLTLVIIIVKVLSSHFTLLLWNFKGKHNLGYFCVHISIDSHLKSRNVQQLSEKVALFKITTNINKAFSIFFLYLLKCHTFSWNIVIWLCHYIAHSYGLWSSSFQQLSSPLFRATLWILLDTNLHHTITLHVYIKNIRGWLSSLLVHGKFRES